VTKHKVRPLADCNTGRSFEHSLEAYLHFIDFTHTCCAEQVQDKSNHVWDALDRLQLVERVVSRHASEIHTQLVFLSRSHRILSRRSDDDDTRNNSTEISTNEF